MVINTHKYTCGEFVNTQINIHTLTYGYVRTTYINKFVYRMLIMFIQSAMINEQDRSQNYKKSYLEAEIIYTHKGYSKARQDHVAGKGKPTYVHTFILISIIFHTYIYTYIYTYIRICLSVCLSFCAYLVLYIFVNVDWSVYSSGCPCVY